MSNIVKVVTEAFLRKLLPIGEVTIWLTDTPPEGWLILDGRTLSKDDYPELYKVLHEKYPGSNPYEFRLPNTTGYFLRAAGKSPVCNDTYAVGQTHNDAIRNITGTLTDAGGCSGNHYAGSGVFSVSSTSVPLNSFVSQTTWDQNVVTFDASTQVPTGNENRPAAMAVYYIIRAK